MIAVIPGIWSWIVLIRSNILLSSIWFIAVVILRLMGFSGTGYLKQWILIKIMVDKSQWYLMQPISQMGISNIGCPKYSLQPYVSIISWPLITLWILIVDIFTRHTRKERRFKLIFSTLISSRDQFLSEDHCYNIVNYWLQHYQLQPL